MLNTKKLLYLLPDLAYIAELLPTKKPNDYSIQNFRQINGELIKKNNLISANLKKLFSKLEEGEYNLVLPDTLFTNTIINVEEESASKVKTYLKENVLADLHVDEESHQIQSFILTTHKGKSKVQLSLIQKSMLAPIGNSIAGIKVKIENIYPLTWTIKSLISLEPSVSVLQLGSHLYMAKHYIGVDQPTMNELENTDRIVEAVKTLKGTEPSIQTLYLMSNELVEEKLKKGLDDILPLQQLADNKNEENKVPSYVSKVVIAGMKTISIEDFELPKFKVETGDEGAKQEPTAGKDQVEDEQELPVPSKITDKTAEKKSKEKEEKVEEVKEKEKEDADKKEEEVSRQSEKEEKIEVKADEEEEIGDIDLGQFVDEEIKIEEAEKKDLSTTKKMKDKPTRKKKKVVKNDDGIGNFVKILFIGLTSFAVTVAIGVGLGLGVLKLSQTDTEVVTPVAETEEATPTEVPTPSPTEAPAINKEELTIKVVNATTKAGYAGTISDQLEEASYGQVTAKNASGDYEEAGYFLLMEEENQALLDEISQDLDLELTYSAEVDIEDPKGEFDAVLVLAKQ
ncbi:MAG: LytR C-terminal domain-containing protein [Patescibacteria group bacterium]|nr:LytR C-terminal domain-containing protein [Patescibacteria group bacterium]